MVSVNLRSEIPSRNVSAEAKDLGNCLLKESAKAFMPAFLFSAISAEAPSAQKNLSSSNAKDRKMPDANLAPVGVGEVA